MAKELVKDTPDSFKISEATLYKEGKKRLTRYGKYVVTNRAIPDYRDGLKVVHRRTIWAMRQLGANPGGKFYKSARVTGDVAGRYHPHGDTSIYDALVLMVNNPVSFVQSQGNFGTWRDSASAPRYTEVKLSKLSDLMLSSDYLNAWKSKIMVPTYDNDSEEPLVLPCLVPNLLLNGNQGIAYGVTSNFPPIMPEDVFGMLQNQIEGKELNLKKIAKNIQFNWPDGSSCVSVEPDIRDWLESGKRALYFQPEYELDEDKRTITFHEVPPNFNWDSVSDKVGDKEFVASIDDYTDKNTKKSATIVVKLKSSVSFEDFEKRSDEIVNIFTNSFSTATNITTRHSEDDIDFARLNMPSFIELWTKYRIGLEVDMQKYRIGRIDEGIAYQNLMLWVADNADAIIKIIRNHQTPKQELMSKFELSDDDAEKILELKLRKLTKLSVEDIKKTKADLKKDKKIAIGVRDNPSPTVESDLHSNLKLIQKELAAPKPKKVKAEAED